MDKFNFTRQALIFPSVEPEHHFHIQDDLLYDCIGLGRGSSNTPDRVTGFSYGKDFGYALLTYFAARALNFKRLPFCEDRIYANFYGCHERYKTILAQLDEQRVDSICAELRSLYQHTQRKLQEKNVNSVNIGRKISSRSNGYVETIIQIKNSAELLGLDTIKVEMDTLNSFGDEGAYFGEVFLKMNVPAKDILYCSSLIGNRAGQNATMETGEWVVLNRSPTGVTELPLSAIHVDNSLWCADKTLTKEKAEKILDRYNPFVFRNLYSTEQNHGTYGLKRSFKGKILSYLLEYLNKKSGDK